MKRFALRVLGGALLVASVPFLALGAIGILLLSWGFNAMGAADDITLSEAMRRFADNMHKNREAPDNVEYLHRHDNDGER